MTKKRIQETPPAALPTDTLDKLYENWFLDYASYVILERAIPRIEDGLKPVQRRIAHAIREMDDGRFNKVANVIGQTMQYHPHGDASIGEAIVNLGQKGLLLETQGNWGDIRTGDGAAAARYIETRLSKFALEVVYNSQTTEWQLSYDGRKREPVTLPIKFPLLLLQGVEGIAVGLSTKILPHNFCELIEASIALLKDKKPELYPDFSTGGYVDCAEYNRGQRGGKVKVRAKIEIQNRNTLVIREIPYGSTTNSLIDSIIKASDKGKIKLKQIVDNTARDVEIVIHLQPDQLPELTVDALYAFTDCEMSISTNACVIVDGKPKFMPVSDILRHSVTQTVELLRRELEIRREELMEKIFFSSLEKIFIEERIYRRIEECETFDAVLEEIDRGLKPHVKQFYRTVTPDDILKLTEIRIKRISKYDAFKTDEALKAQHQELDETTARLQGLTAYAIAYYSGLLKKYGEGRERKTVIKNFQSVDAAEVIASNQKLYANRADGFVGWGLKKDEYICDCSDIDDVIVIRKDGCLLASRIAEKQFIGKDILYVGVWKKGDERMVYNLIYEDGKTGICFAKRFAVPALIRDREYDLTQGTPKSRVHYLSANPNGEAETVEIKLSAASAARKKVFEFDFTSLDVKGRDAKGNILTRYPIRKATLTQAGLSTLAQLKLWFDPASGRLNKEGRGNYVGKLASDDKIISVNCYGKYRLSPVSLSLRFEPEGKTLLVEKFDPKKSIAAVYKDGESLFHFIKRFHIETLTPDRDFLFISPHSRSVLLYVDTAGRLEVSVKVMKGKKAETKTVNLAEVAPIKGWRAMGNRLSPHKVISIEPVPTSGEDTPEAKPKGKFSAGDTIELAF